MATHTTVIDGGEWAFLSAFLFSSPSVKLAS